MHSNSPGAGGNKWFLIQSFLCKTKRQTALGAYPRIGYCVLYCSKASRLLSSSPRPHRPVERKTLSCAARATTTLVPFIIPSSLLHRR